MQGQLFTQDFLTRGVLETLPWRAFDDVQYLQFESTLRSIYAGLSTESTLNEAQTEAVVINRVLLALGWDDCTLPQVNLSAKRRQDVPDCLLFASADKKTQALAEAKDDRRYRHGIAILEAKRWLRPLDRSDASEAFDPDAPSSQMLRYLSRADGASDRAVKWGILTNGNVWRLYWQDARSRSEEFFEVDVAAALGIAGTQAEWDGIAPAHALRLFYVFFQRLAFLQQDWLLEKGESSGRSFHAYALNEARLYEEKVSQDLGARVFADIFPKLADALARGDLQSCTQETGIGQFRRKQFTPDYLDEVREATLVLLYRLLFLFYAEDRNLLPVRDARYAQYSVRSIRQQVRDKVDTGGAYASSVPRIWFSLRMTFDLIHNGDDSIGMPAYNGGLFAAARSQLLERTHIPDRVMAPIIDTLSRRTEDVARGWINYRDLAVAHLGSIYERLLEYSLIHHVQAKDDYKDKPEIDQIRALPASFARKTSGGYYTHDDLVRLILRESVGTLAQDRVEAFAAHLKKISKKTALNPGDWDALDAQDPAGHILKLKICDPAMGSGHFLVALVDDLADRILEAITTTTQAVNAQPWAAHLAEAGRPWQSPVLQRIAAIRQNIKSTAKHHGWAVTNAQLDDRHIVRRMILKKCVFGVDKNAMAVELAKTALWLHTFTVGAPLSFLDHHLRTGDSLHGEQLPQVQRDLQNLGALLMQTEFNRLALAAKAIAQVADLTDVDIAEAQLSKQLATEAAEQVAPIHAVLDFWRAMRWIVPGWPVDKVSKLPALLKLPKDPTERKAQLDAGLHPDYAGLLKLLAPGHNLVQVLGAGRLDGSDAATVAANLLMARARAIARRETFFHWQTTFPTAFGVGSAGGFDAVIGNPPWDRIKLQQVEWFAERNPAIASQPRAEDRKKMIAALQHANMTQTGINTPPVVDLWAQYQQAMERAEANARVLGNGKLGSSDYPLLGGGDINLYSLFVERAQSLINPQGLVALITPSGIAADKGAAEFFQSISSTGKLRALFDFENRKVFFPDVDSRFKFCALVFGRQPRYQPAAVMDADVSSKNPVFKENQAVAPVPIAQAATNNVALTLPLVGRVSTRQLEHDALRVGVGLKPDLPADIYMPNQAVAPVSIAQVATNNVAIKNFIEAEIEAANLPVPSRCAFFLHSLDELDAPERVLTLSAQDFQRVNPNTGAAPIFRSQRDADITLKLYAQHPVLVLHGELSEARGQQPDARVWPVKYHRMFDMTNDSDLFLKADELAQQGWQPAALNRWEKPASSGKAKTKGSEKPASGKGKAKTGVQVALPLYVGRMVHQYDHRHANVTVNEDNLQNAAFGTTLSSDEKSDPNVYPQPQYFVEESAVPSAARRSWVLSFRDIARATDVRTMIAAIVPSTAAGNKLPFLLPAADAEPTYTSVAPLLLANLNSIAFDFVARQKVQSTSMNWYILEQLPVIAPARFDEPLPPQFTTAMRAAGLLDRLPTKPAVADFVLQQVLRLSYTAHDMAAFARDLGYVDASGAVLPPFVWDEADRRARLAALDALFFWLYGLDAAAATYILGTFPIVREQDRQIFGCYRTQDDILAALALLGVTV